MPEKDIGLWMTIHNALKEQGLAIMLVSILTAIRMCREEKRPNIMTIIMDSSSSALTVFAVGLACKEFGFSYGWALAASGFIGVFGLEMTKYFIRKLIDKKIEQGTNFTTEDDEL